MAKPLTPLAILLAGADLRRLTLIREAAPTDRHDGGGRVRFGVFQCRCGAVTTARADNVRRSRTRSCGCVNVELTIARNATRARSGRNPE